MNAISDLKAVLCDTEGEVSIQGSDEDRDTVQKALAELELEAARGSDIDMSKNNPLLFNGKGELIPNLKNMEMLYEIVCPDRKKTLGE
jgi:hypothetical protein